MDQINDHINLQNLFPEYQSAYHKNHSCETSLLKVMNTLLWNIENGMVTVLVAIDLSAAFDTVDHDILLNVVEKEFGITGNVLNWCKTYLANRAFKVCVGKEYSEEKIFNFSVPQGSCNKPSYVSIYTSTIQSHISIDLELNAFVDDHTFNKGFKPKRDQELAAVKSVENNLLSVHKWINQNWL